MDNPDRALLEHLIANKDFGVPLDMTHGLRELEAHLVKGEPGSLELSFNVSHRSTQGNGVVSGGTLATMLDYAMAYAVLSKLNAGKTCATTSITVTWRPGNSQGSGSRRCCTRSRWCSRKCTRLRGVTNRLRTQGSGLKHGGIGVRDSGCGTVELSG